MKIYTFWLSSLPGTKPFMFVRCRGVIDALAKFSKACEEEGLDFNALNFCLRVAPDERV